MSVIKWGSVLDDAPRLQMSKPVVPGHMQAQAERMIPVPANCKPWLDAQKTGLIIVWPHDTLTIKFGSSLETHEIGTDMEYMETVESPHMEWQGDYVAKFAPWHYSLLPQYVFQTPPGIGLYVVGLPDDYKSPIDQRTVQRGVLETDWYAVPPFFVFKIPFMYGEQTIIINRGDPLCMVVPVVLNPTSEVMSDAELMSRLEHGEAYIDERASRDDLLWITGNHEQMFSHLYKERSRNADKWRRLVYGEFRESNESVQEDGS